MLSIKTTELPKFKKKTIFWAYSLKEEVIDYVWLVSWWVIYS